MTTQAMVGKEICNLIKKIGLAEVDGLGYIYEFKPTTKLILSPLLHGHMLKRGIIFFA